MWPQQLISSLVLSFVQQKVCYNGYGCFSNSPPYDVSFALLPRDPVILNTTYHWNTREERLQFTAPFYDDLPRLEKLGKKNRTFIIAHGFIEHSRKFWVSPIIEELLKNNDCNVIFVDWENGAGYPFNQAFGDARVVAVEVADLIKRLNDIGLAPIDTIHLIGFSLGAHMMGRVGHTLKTKGLTVPRITGLDPAGPKLDNAHKDVSLDNTDAEFVDVIHSDASTPLLGTLKRQGHVDFYPNGGLHQPGCKKSTVDIFSKEAIFDLVSCSHYRAVLYFIHSINHPLRFKSFKCHNYKSFLRGQCSNCQTRQGHPLCQHLGLHVDKKARGKFYLLTTSEKPFAGHQYHLRMKTGNIPDASLHGIIEFRLIGEKTSSKIQTIERKTHGCGTSAYLTFVTPHSLGEIVKLKMKAHSRAWFEDKWFVRDMAIKKLGGKRWHGCVRKWIYDKFQIVQPSGKVCKITDKTNIAKKVLQGRTKRI